MSSSPRLLFLTLLLASPAGLPAPGDYGYGKPATAEEIAGWDIDIRPDGQGLPPGSGSVADGEWIYEDQCAECHGSFGEGVGRYPALAGGEGTLTDMRPHKTVGSFWAHTSTLWDYIHRAMPFTRPESLPDEDVYAVTAYVLYLNDIVDGDFELSQDNLASIELPNRHAFKPDDRPDTKNTRCMNNCKEPGSVSVTSMVEPPAPAERGEEQVAEPVISSLGKSIYDQACGLCHNNGVSGAPILGDAAEWRVRSQSGIDSLVSNAIEGYTGENGVMPPRGGFAGLSNDDVSAAVSFMMESVE